MTSTLLWTASVGLYTVSNAMALAIGAYLWGQQAITIGTVYLIFYYATLLYQPIEQIREELENLQQAEASILRIPDLLQVQSRISLGGDQPLPAGALSVGFEIVGNQLSLLIETQQFDQARSLLPLIRSQLNLKAKIDRNPTTIVHLATHGQFSSDAAQPFILAWDRPIDAQELGTLLRSADDRRSAIELLVLSACETAAGDDRAALSLAGVAVQSGARSTLASLWSLNDDSAARLIGEFYRELLNPKLSKTAALR